MHISSNEKLDRKSEHGLPQISEPRLTDPGEFLLLREMTHRINNELTSAISLASVMTTRSDSCDVKIALASMIEHLYDHASVYRALQMPTDNGRADDLVDLARSNLWA
jgi:two-component sensor histidine kinase